MRRARQALNRLEREGKVARFGGMFAEWRATKYPEVEQPSTVKDFLDDANAIQLMRELEHHAAKRDA